MKTNLYDVICFLGDEYLNINRLWQDDNINKVNLRKNSVANIYNKENMIDIIRKYQCFLLETTIELNLKLEDKYGMDCRVKTQNSIEDKIRKYCSSSVHSFGKLPICKCLNDLYGARIVLDGDLTFNEIYNFIKENNFFKDSQVKLKCINATKGDYKATHIYFIKQKDNLVEGDNSAFQWELQIWLANDERNNIKSHGKYKQGYTKWENTIIKEGE